VQDYSEARPVKRTLVIVRAIVGGLLVGMIPANVWLVFLVVLKLPVPIAVAAELLFLALYVWWARGVEEMREQLPQLDHLLVVEADVGQHRDLGPVERDRAVAFVDLADEQLRVADQRAREGGRGRHEILHQRAVHHRRLAVTGVEDPADHAGDGGFPAGPADGDAALRRVEQLGEELRPRQVLQPKRLRPHDVRYRVLDRRRGDQRHARLQPRSVLREQLDSERAQIIELVRRPPRVERPVGPRDLRPGSAHDRRQRQHPTLPNAAEENWRFDRSRGPKGRCG
jgi:hypothetical protein